MLFRFITRRRCISIRFMIKFNTFKMVGVLFRNVCFMGSCRNQQWESIEIRRFSFPIIFCSANLIHLLILSKSQTIFFVNIYKFFPIQLPNPAYSRCASHILGY